MQRNVGIAVATVAAMVMIVGSVFAQTKPTIGNSYFQRVWERQDLLISEGRGTRSWTWGPTVSERMEEKLIEAPEGKRTVQYFEKSRMEINYAKDVDPNSLWYVTNGLLPKELITGDMQVGENTSENRGPAKISAMGDLDCSGSPCFPTYADLGRVYQRVFDPTDIGKAATRLFNADGSITTFETYTSDPGTTVVKGSGDYGIPQAFVDFQNQTGKVYENGKYIDAAIYNSTFVFGLPITGPYWVKTMVGGKEIPILFQIFERRVVTYNPQETNAAFKIQMGNVGTQYYQWRYGVPTTPISGTATVAPTAPATTVTPYPAP